MNSQFSENFTHSTFIKLHLESVVLFKELCVLLSLQKHTNFSVKNLNQVQVLLDNLSHSITCSYANHTHPMKGCSLLRFLNDSWFADQINTKQLNLSVTKISLLVVKKYIINFICTASVKTKLKKVLYKAEKDLNISALECRE